MHTFSKRSNRGSAAINILIVLIMIAVLAAVLFPAFTHSDKSCPSRCQNNIKELAVSIQVYWNDYDSKLPSSMLVSHSEKWNKADFLTFSTKLGQLPPTGKRQTYIAILYDHIKNKDIPFCPLDKAKDNIDQNSKTSYYWKTAIDKAWYGEGCKKPCRKEADFGYNSDQIILYERAGFHSGDDFIKNGTMINVAYMDSHVKAITIKNATSGDPKNPAAADDGEPMYFNCNLEQDKGLSSKTTPAKFVDPKIYGDNFSVDYIPVTGTRIR